MRIAFGNQSSKRDSNTPSEKWMRTEKSEMHAKYHKKDISNVFWVSGQDSVAKRRKKKKTRQRKYCKALHLNGWLPI